MQDPASRDLYAAVLGIRRSVQRVNLQLTEGEVHVFLEHAADLECDHQPERRWRHPGAALPRRNATGMRFFGGLGEDEVAEVLGVSQVTVKRDWRIARAFLLSRVGGTLTD